jgi:putative ABC transport system permease protein
MNNSLYAIPVLNLLLAFGPVLIVVGVLYRWSVESGTALYALGRMVVQLVLVGYVLVFVFRSDRVSVVLGVLAVMLMAASWISMRPLMRRTGVSYVKALGSICTGGVLTLIIVTQGVLDLEPWYEPRFVVPLAGMIFATSMNTVSLAAERFEAETRRGSTYQQSRRVALRAALIPMFNTLLAVGLVSIPGMMTGQILSGVAPLIAVRYQIMVMCMIFGAAGISAACYLVLRRNETNHPALMESKWR